MRLIDADKLEKDLAELYQQEGWNPDEVHFSLQDVIANNWGRAVEAIPIEWINDWVNREGNTHWFVGLLDMLEDWKRENEQTHRS